MNNQKPADVAAIQILTHEILYEIGSMPMGREESRARANEASYLADAIAGA